MPDPELLFRVTVPGITRGCANRFTVAQRRANDIMVAALLSGAHRGVKVLQDYAPESDRPHRGRLRRSIGILGTARRQKNVRYPKFEVGVDQTLPTPGFKGGAVSERFFPYLEVTRRGRKGFGPSVARRSGSDLRPTARELTEGGVPTGRKLGRAAMLAFPDQSGQIIFRRRVGNWRPPRGDWVKLAEPEVRAVAQEEMNKVLPAIEEILTRGFTRTVRGRRF